MSIEIYKNRIRGAISGFLNGDDGSAGLYFATYCAVFDIPLEEMASPDLADKIIVSVYKKLGLQADSSEAPSGELGKILEVILETTAEMIENSKINFDTIISYRPTLRSKERSLVGTNEYGDQDLSGWVDFTAKFGYDKLRGIAPLRLYIEIYASDEHRWMLRRAGLLDMFGLLTRQALVLLQHFSNDEDAAPVTGVDYENFLKKEIEERFPDSHVEKTPASGDHGVDLIFDCRGKRVAIQAKYYKSSVGNAAVQEAHAGKGFTKSDYAMVICESGFTRHANELASSLDVYLETTSSYLNKLEMILSS